MLNEHKTQVALLNWMRYKHPQAYKMIYATPNAGMRTPRQGAYMKSEGLKAGVPDLCLAMPSNGYHGLYIELKTTKGRATPKQSEWLKNLNSQGYCAKLCKGLDEAIDAVNQYLTAGKDT